MNSLVTLRNVMIPAPTEDDRRADDQRIRDALGLGPLEIPLAVLRKLPERRGHELACSVGRHSQGYCLIDVSCRSSFSVAMDLGTTNIAARLHDNVSGRVLSEAKMENPQLAFGSDILTRLHQAMTGKADELCACLRDGASVLIRKLCRDAGVEEASVHALAAAGNTVMSHFFLGLDVSRIPVAPFAPVSRKPGFFRARDLGLAIHPEALVHVLPNAGSYVGGDIVAGILASGMFGSEDPAVLIDVGTNAEVVIGCRDWLLVGAGAAGPALEEGIAGIGKRADRGIVYDVEIRNGRAVCRTFDDLPAAGVCGSGMVSLVCELYRAGIIGNDGALNPEQEGVEKLDGEMSFMLSCPPGSGLVIRQREIDNFLRSKAAMFTLLLVLLRSVGLGFGDIRKVYVAGALGTGIDAEKAAAIGMLPQWPASAIVPLGNASLEGAFMILKDSSLLGREDELIDRITYKHMHDDPEFMKEFAGAVFIPHTNPEMLKVR
ncbi:MAG: DUF4445 domain-containing protein [Nitrospiraceae bacterium]|nr:MAG: DUF4445 domain-containing protein [Nitrospiraceae bacterium]